MEDKQGKFEVIDSFLIRKKNEYYLIGNLIEGEIKENWFINVAFNSSLSLTVKIDQIEEVEISNDNNRYTLLIVKGEDEKLDFLLGLKIGSEFVDITINGEE